MLHLWVICDSWFMSQLEEKRQNEVRQSEWETGQICLEWMYCGYSWTRTLKPHSPHILPHTSTWTARGAPLRFFFFLSLSHPSISSNFFFQSHDPSRMLSHTGSSLGRSFSCSLLGCNNYSISQQCVPWLCSWAVSVGGVQWRGETRVWLSLQGKGNMFFFLWAGAHPGPTRGEQE